MMTPFNQSLTPASESPLFGSVVRALVLYRGHPGLIPSKGRGIFLAMLYFVTAIISLNQYTIYMCYCFQLKWDYQYNIYNFKKDKPDLLNFDISGCYQFRRRRKFQFSLPGKSQGKPLLQQGSSLRGVL